VVVDFTIRLAVAVPDAWPPDQIETHYNLGTWCAANFPEQIHDVTDDGCVCPNAQVVYVSEADGSVAQGRHKARGRSRG
jgi:hypothetical protein